MAAVAEVANREEAEKAYARAEALFVAGDVPGARRLAIRARRLSPSLPGVTHALAAYDIHAAASANNNPGYNSCWHAVLGLDGGQHQTTRADEEAVKRQFRRRSLLVHPDKNRSAAAEGAFKLLRRPATPSSPPAPPAHITTAGPRPLTVLPPPPPPPRTGSVRTTQRRSARARRLHRHIQPGTGGSGESGPGRGSPTAPTTTTTRPRSKETTTTGKPKPPTFPCPRACPRCEARFTSEVSAGHWMLQCKACHKSVMVHVRGPDAATCWTK